MNDTQPPAATPAPDRAARRAWQIAGLGGGGLGVLLAALAAAAGASGTAGLRFFLLGLLAGTSLGALWAVVAAVRASLRAEPLGRRLLVAAAVLGAATIVLPVMLVGPGE